MNTCFIVACAKNSKLAKIFPRQPGKASTTDKIEEKEELY